MELVYSQMLFLNIKFGFYLIVLKNVPPK